MIVGRIVNGRYETEPTPQARRRSFREMLRSKKPPACQTDSQFCAMHGNLGKQIVNTSQREMIAHQARLAGVPQDSVYMPTLADHPGDPKAMFTSRAEMKRRSKELMDREVDPSPAHKLHPRLVREIRDKMVAQDPGLKHKDQRELAESIIDKHGCKS